MITNADTSVALSSLGWVDGGSIWRFESSSGDHDSIELSDADYLRLFGGDAHHFTVQHNWGATRFMVTAHRWDQPERVVSAIHVDGWAPRIEGDETVWASLPRAFVGFLGRDETGAAGYFVLTLRGSSCEVARLDWFGDDYDLGYQGVISVVELPGSLDMLFGIQRSSHLVRTSAELGNVTQVPLADRHGNAEPVLSQHGPAIWGTDYDTVVRLDRTTWKTAASQNLQPSPDGTAMFVGNPWLPPDEMYLLVPRPGSGDAVILDPHSLAPTNSVDLGQEPLVGAVLKGDRVVARDWKSGELLVGHF